MSQTAIATKIGTELTSKLQGITDEKVIKALSIEAWKELRAKIEVWSSFRSRGLNTLRKEIEKTFPESETAKPGYYHTTQGQGRVSRYEHLSIWYLTSSTDRWEITGDEARQAYFNNLPELPKSEPQSEPQPEPQSEPQPALKLEAMTLQQLELDTETQEIVQTALNHSGMTLADFVKQACKVYARTVVGKAEQATETDLSKIPTSVLLKKNTKEDKNIYKTLPGRAEELARRAIQAIMCHNDVSTEKSQKWCVTATAINALTGSKMILIKNVMEQYRVMIDDHNTKHGLNPYDNRGRVTTIEQDIDFVNFSETNVPVATPVTETPMTVTPTPLVIPVKQQIIPMPLTSTTQQIWDKLQEKPNAKIQIKDGRKALHYLKINNSQMRIEETDEVVSF